MAPLIHVEDLFRVSMVDGVLYGCHMMSNLSAERVSATLLGCLDLLPRLCVDIQWVNLDLLEHRSHVHVLQLLGVLLLVAEVLEDDVLLLLVPCPLAR